MKTDNVVWIIGRLRVVAAYLQREILTEHELRGHRAMLVAIRREVNFDQKRVFTNWGKIFGYIRQHPEILEKRDNAVVDIKIDIKDDNDSKQPLLSAAAVMPSSAATATAASAAATIEIRPSVNDEQEILRNLMDLLTVNIPADKTLRKLFDEKFPTDSTSLAAVRDVLAKMAGLFLNKTMALIAKCGQSSERTIPDYKNSDNLPIYIKKAPHVVAQEYFKFSSVHDRVRVLNLVCKKWHGLINNMHVTAPIAYWRTNRPVGVLGTVFTQRNDEKQNPADVKFSDAQQIAFRRQAGEIALTSLSNSVERRDTWILGGVIVIFLAIAFTVLGISIKKNSNLGNISDLVGGGIALSCFCFCLSCYCGPVRWIARYRNARAAERALENIGVEAPPALPAPQRSAAAAQQQLPAANPSADYKAPEARL